jgi:hypothetical protein
MTTPAVAAGIRSVELEVTGRCQLKCGHCCTRSGPKASAGAMTPVDWMDVIADIAGLQPSRKDTPIDLAGRFPPRQYPRYERR